MSVYLDAFVPQDGQSLSTLRGPAAKPFPPGLVVAPAATAFHVNANDAAWVDSKMTPHPAKCFTEPLRVSGAYQTIAQELYIRAR